MFEINDLIGDTRTIGPPYPLGTSSVVLPLEHSGKFTDGEIEVVNPKRFMYAGLPHIGLKLGRREQVCVEYDGDVPSEWFVNSYSRGEELFVS